MTTNNNTIEPMKNENHYQEKYREQIHYLLDRLETKFKKGDYELSEPWKMFIPTYIRGICNTVEDQKAVPAQDLYDLTRIFSVMSLCPAEDVKHVMKAMSAMVMESCGQESGKPEYSHLSDDAKDWLDKI